MITKLEFLERVKREVFPTLNEKDLNRRKVITALLSFVFIGVFAGLLKYALEQRPGISDGEFKGLSFVCFVGFFGIYFFYRNFLNKKIEETKQKLFHEILGVPRAVLSPNEDELLKELEELNDDENGHKRYAVIVDQLEKSAKKWKKDIEKSKLFKNKSVSKCDITEDTTMFFDNIKASVFEGCFYIYHGRSSDQFFKGLFVQIQTEHFYKEPIIFAKRGLFNKRKDAGKIQLRRQDVYFDVFSNDVGGAQSLCLQGITSKLSRTNKFLKIKKVEAAFFQDKLYIALYTKKNLFEPITKHLTDIQQYELFYDEVAQIESYCAQFKGL